MPARHLIFATRPSALARYQTQWVMKALQKIHPGVTCEEKIITTQGDKVLDQPLPEIGGKGLFTQELESELLSGNVHCAVHSLKDLPVESMEELTVACIPERVDARDVLISAKGYRLKSLPAGAIVGTSSLRRSAQVLAVRPDLRLESLRGNVDTRIRKAVENQYDAILLAGAGVQRLGLESYIIEWLPIDVIMPAPGQGALAVQCRQGDQDTRDLLSVLNHPATLQAVTAERQFLLGLGGGCSIPVAANATLSGTSHPWIHLMGRIASLDGKHVLDFISEGPDADLLGLGLAKQALAQGAGEILSINNYQ